MKYEVYNDLKSTPDFSITDFVSVGKNGIIHKRISFTATTIQNVYNLAFGDIDERGEIDDYRKSDNGDRNKILATIYTVVDDYTIKYPERLILFSGSTKERTRLYRIAIGLNLEELSRKFEVYAYVNNELVIFSKNMEISAFLIKRKNA
jgi:hypothetical protein